MATNHFRRLKRTVVFWGCGLLLACAAPCPGVDYTATLARSFFPPPGSDGSIFGARTYVFENTLAIGANQAKVGGVNAGVQYYYDTETGNLLHALPNPFPNAGDLFGSSAVAMDNGLLVVSALFDDTDGSDSGIAYVYSTNTWEVVRVLHSPNPTTGGRFGERMTRYGSYVVIGAPGDQVDGINSGAAYLMDPNNGALIQTYKHPTPGSGDFFGYTVAVSGDFIVIGARYDDVGGTRDVGSAFLFNALSGTFHQSLPNPTPARDDNYGIAVTGVPGLAIVAARDDDTRGANSGAVYIFDSASGGLLRTLYSPHPSDDGRFGFVSAWGDLLLVGATGDYTNGIKSGAAYVYTLSDGSLQETLFNPSPNTDDLFGEGASIHMNKVLVGAFRDDSAGGDAGAAHLFDVLPANLPPNPPTVTLSPEAPFTLDNLFCAAEGSVDPEGASVTYEYKWYRDDVLIAGDGMNSVTGPTLSHLYTTRGDAIRCTVRATDGISFSTPASDTVVILNTPPPRPEVRILPENPTPDDGLAVLLENPDPVDPDGDVVLPLFSWFQSVNASVWVRRPELSGSLFPNFYPGQPEISALYTQAAEYWRVDVTFVDFENELAAQAALKGDSPIAPEKDVSDTDSYVTFILPDIDGDNQVGASDLLLVRAFWLKTQSQIPFSYRPAFFEPSDPPEKRIGIENLLGLAGPGWQHGRN